MALTSVLTIIAVIGVFSRPVVPQVLTPPYFNLAEGRRITASSTCGVDVAEPELFCKLVGANSDKSSHSNVIQGQLCDVCDPNDRENAHPPKYAIDGSERWWQSPPLSRGMTYNQVNLTVDLGQLFQVAYIIIKMGNSPRPGIWVLERSVDNGETYAAWQYFADNEQDCRQFFGNDTVHPIRRDDDVICTTKFSKVVPLEGGEIVVSLLNYRPSANDFFNSTELQEFTRATNVRLKLIRAKTLLGHLMSVAQQDPTVTRRYFYSIKDISIGGRCVCNGHASLCDIPDPTDQYKLQCRCEHHTCGNQCEECCPGFIQKKWRPASVGHNFICEPCNCFGHSDQCIFDEQIDEQNKSLDIYGQYEGGGVCQNCRHNTEGVNCDECIDGFYRPYGKKLNETDVCRRCNCYSDVHTNNCRDGDGLCECKIQYQPPLCDSCSDGYYDFPQCFPCDCHRLGTVGGICQVGGGQCPCKDNYSGINCDQCAPGYYSFPECIPCSCISQGSLDAFCEQESGHCNCQNNYGGDKCERCANGYYDYEDGCQFCNCDVRGAVEGICDKNTGDCLCKEGFSSDRCDTNAPGFWGYPMVQICGCHEKGSASTICDITGKCPCIVGYSGRSCDQCSPGYFNFPKCEPCNCDASGSIGVSCSADGECQCKHNFDGIHCDQCKEEFYNFPLCEECNCDPAGVLETFGGCGDAPVGELCECKERVTGRICNKCRSLYWNLQQENPVGCEECSCHMPGTIGGLSTCDWMSGQCICKPKVNSRQCDECVDGTFNLMEDSLFGCSDCNCNIGGSEHQVCDKDSGQCHCRHRVEGQRCDRPMKAHYFATLYQLKYEAEDGYNQQNTPLRFGYDSDVMRNFTGRGYAIFSDLQRKTIYNIHIFNPTLYRTIFYYRNPSTTTVKAKIVVTPENPQDVQQKIEVHFPPTSQPSLLTASTEDGIPVTLVLNPPAWQLSLETDGDLYLDYFVLLPLAYYEATILTESVTRQCQISSTNEPCLHYSYPAVDSFETVFGSAGYIDTAGYKDSIQVFDNNEVLTKLHSETMAWLNDDQPEIHFNVRLSNAGPHVLLLNYFTPYGSKAVNLAVTVNTKDGGQEGRTLLYDCTYGWVCRQVVSNLRGEVAHFDFDDDYITIVLKKLGSGEDIAVHSLVVVPIEDWNIGMVVPSPVCTKMGQDCIQDIFPAPPDSAKIEFESNREGDVAKVWPPGVDNSTLLVGFNEGNRMVELSGKIRTYGRYVFLVHYFQPTYPETTVYALVKNGKFYEGELTLKHCPSTSGCRAVISRDDGSILFDVLENFVLSLKGDGKEVWLDYVLVIPEDHFQPSQMQKLPKDNTVEFFERCGTNNFYIDPSETGYCRDAAFALTTRYNNGALPCNCNHKGSLSFECEVFGGQCKCRPNVIGRECDRCATGYFGFPNCRPCDCPSTALCDAVTGECICPPRVVGGRCERCAENTYGYDPLIGCDECRCDENGVANFNLQCDLMTGQCQCKNKVIGRRCDKCAAGYWAFPFCQLCSCDVRGTEDDICSQTDASCSCKEFTEGPACELCVTGTYHLEESNPDGCTECFCFGKAQQCSSANLFWSQIIENTGWESLILSSENGVIMKREYDDKVIKLSDGIYLDLVNASSIEHYESVIYFSAPEHFLRNKLKSYGGILKFTMQANIDQDDRKLGRDVILEGNNMTAVYIFFEDQITNRLPKEVKIRLTERSFQTNTGEPMKREEFMTILHNLEGLHIRARYAANPDITKLSQIRLDEAINEYKTNRDGAHSVEQCQCPLGYKGSSCEDCGYGYFRAEAGPYGGYCIPCQCNNHADTCDPHTGICQQCRDSTRGDHCEECGVGHFGTATDGTPHDCLMCSCPTPSITNNFAISCQEGATDEEFVCDCRPSYIGRKCERCAPGHYGRPDKMGDYCKPCECNDNINPLSPFACDDISGLCRQCLNNTYGAHCEFCSPGFYGDAIIAKDCKECSCDECGTRMCEHQTGVCQCQRNVIGTNCDRCERDHWGYSSCQGCLPCVCSEASETTQCDMESGQCLCRFGVTGRHCERCKPGFWDYSEYGCKECSCREGFSVGVGCDPQTGQCSCLPGVIGDNCESCPHRWILIEGLGCQECDDCVHALLETTSQLHSMLYPVVEEYASAKKSFFLHQRLQLFNDSTVELRPSVDSLDLSLEDFAPLEKSLQHLEEQSLSNSHQASLSHDRSEMASSDGETLKMEAGEVLKNILGGANLTRNVVQEINLLVSGLQTGTGARIELAIREADAILNKMKETDFDMNKMKVEEDYEIAEEFVYRMKNLSFPVNGNIERVDEISNRLNKLDEMISEMQDYISESQKNTFDSRNHNQENRAVGLRDLRNKFEDISAIGEEAKSLIGETNNFTKEARVNLDNAIQNYNVIEEDFKTLLEMNNNLNETVNEVNNELPSIRDISQEAMLHAEQLKIRANELDSMLTDTRQAAENALAAANSYDNIVDAVKQATEAAYAARNASKEAVNLSKGVSDDAIESVMKSEEIHSQAESSVNQVHGSLLPQLDDSEKAVTILGAMNKFADSKIFDINEKLRELRGDSVKEEAISLQEEAQISEDKATEVSDLVYRRYDQLGQYAEDARSLTHNLEDADRDKKLALEQVKGFEEEFPEMNNRTSDLQKQSAFLQNRLQHMGDRMEKLRRTIAKTREQANKIKVGMEFKAGSLVELKNLDDLSDTATNTEVSLYINTKDQLGLPLFLGTPVGGNNLMHRTSTDDFMAIEIDGGFVRLTTNLGAGPQSLTNSKYVSDGNWYKIGIKRVGKVVRLSVHTEDVYGNEDVETSEKVLPGSFSILNLDNKVSKLYVGGIPPGEQVDASLIATNFNGKVEDLWINKRPIGLWNFVKRDPPDAILYGAKERDILKQVTLNGLRFDGNGYALLETKNLDISNRFSVQLTFKTLSEDGLLFILENGENEFVTLELRSGKVMYQQNFGENGAVLTDNTYNDDFVHTIEITKDNNEFVLKMIDSGEEKQGSHTGNQFGFTDTPGIMYFGGFPGKHQFSGVTNDDYRGCIQKVEISEKSIDFLKSKESIGTVPGCPNEIVNMVSFHPSTPGFVKLPSPEGNALQLVLKFRTEFAGGMIFYTETADKSVYLSLSLVDGALVLRSAPDGELTTGTYTQYNDSNWHFVIATIENHELRLDIDDFEKYSVELIQDSVTFDGPVFFGGIEHSFQTSNNFAASGKHFFGCIGDVTLNGRIIDFSIARKVDRRGAILATCSLAGQVVIDDDNIDLRPPVTPSVEIEETTTRTTQRMFITTTNPPLTKCVLPVNPAKDLNILPEDGARYGLKRDSRIEYSTLPHTLRGDFSFSLDFKTVAEEGIIFYSSNINHRHFVNIYLKDGKIVFSFATGSYATVLRSKGRYEDDEWHTLMVERQGESARMEVDGYIEAIVEASGETKHIQHNPPYYFGGVNVSINQLVRDNTEQTDLSFDGCMRDFRMNSDTVSGSRKVVGVERCSYKVERGTFLGQGPRSHVVVQPRFNVGTMFSLSLDIKPRQNTGVIMSVHGRRDFILLQLREGTVEFKIDNGKGIVVSEYVPSDPFYFCDGNWHTIKVVKNRNVAILLVDDVSTTPSSGPLGTNSADTNNPLFLGTQPRLARRRGKAVGAKYVGCIKNVILNEEEVNLSYALLVGNVNAGVCPLI